MNDAADHGAEAFFREQRGAFEHTLATGGPEAALLQAWDSFDGNVASSARASHRWLAARAAPAAASSA